MGMRFNKALQRSRVLAGYIFAIIFFVFCRPTTKFIVIGSVIGLFGLLVRGRATGHLRKELVLETSGPYAYTRNPLYLGSFLLTVGFAVASGVWWLGAVSIIFFLGIYLVVMDVEKKELEKVFGSEYRQYGRKVPIFVPRLTPWKNSTRGFDFQLYLKNREYVAAVGFLLAVLGLIARAYFMGSL